MRHPCKQCNKHPARYKSVRGTYKADKEHDLCRRCAHSVKDRERAVRLVSV